MRLRPAALLSPLMRPVVPRSPVTFTAPCPRGREVEWYEEQREDDGLGSTWHWCKCQCEEGAPIT